MVRIFNFDHEFNQYNTCSLHITCFTCYKQYTTNNFIRKRIQWYKTLGIFNEVRVCLDCSNNCQSNILALTQDLGIRLDGSQCFFAFPIIWSSLYFFSPWLGQTRAAKSFAKYLARPRFGRARVGWIQTDPNTPYILLYQEGVQVPCWHLWDTWSHPRHLENLQSARTEILRTTSTPTKARPYG
jgi:hypothetical protein